MIWTVRTVTLRLSPPDFKPGGRELCVVFSCVVLECRTVHSMSARDPSDTLGWTPLGGVSRDSLQIYFRPRNPGMSMNELAMPSPPLDISVNLTPREYVGSVGGSRNTVIEDSISQYFDLVLEVERSHP